MQRLIPNENWVRLAIVPALVFIAMSVNNQYLLDFWHHLARGREIVTRGEILNHDVFTYTVQGISFRDVNWLTQICYFMTFEWGGLPLVKVLNSLTLAVTFLLLVLLCRNRCGSLALAAAAGIGAFFGSWEILAVRPQTFSMLLFVLVLWALDQSSKRVWLLFIPPVLIGLWANIHGAFPAGIILVGGYLAGLLWQTWPTFAFFKDRRCQCLFACLIATVLATLVNPYGWHIYKFVGQTSGRATARALGEWLPPGLDSLTGWAFFLSLIMVAGLHLVAWLRLKRKPQVHDVILLLCFGVLACRSVRMAVWWFLVAAPIASGVVMALVSARAKIAAPTKSRSLAAALVFAVIAAAVVFALPGLDRFNPLFQVAGRNQRRTETDLEVVHQHLQMQGDGGRIFTRFEWGEYFTWTASPNYKVFMDGRIDIYPDDIWQQYKNVTRGKETWQEILGEYKVNYLVLDVPYHSRQGLIGQVESSAEWRKLLNIRNEIHVYARRSSHAVASSDSGATK